MKAASDRLWLAVVATLMELMSGACRKPIIGLMRSDIYQLFAYAKKYLAVQKVRKVYLIYPASDTFTKPLPAFWYSEGKKVLHVVPYDLKTERLLVPSIHSDLNRRAWDKTGTGDEKVHKASFFYGQFLLENENS